MNKLVILSDIHGNLSALQAVIQDFQSKYSPEAIVLLGDLIDYGMRSNEVIELIQNLEKNIQFSVIFRVIMKLQQCLRKII